MRLVRATARMARASWRSRTDTVHRCGGRLTRRLPTKRWGQWPVRYGNRSGHCPMGLVALLLPAAQGLVSDHAFAMPRTA
ncbi:hypothetical protein CLV65_0054 [Pseudoscardovia suis]|nr:hypothetical protein CLV65_0054 [Pseudoscardovia suis]